MQTTKVVLNCHRLVLMTWNHFGRLVILLCRHDPSDSPLSGVPSLPVDILFNFAKLDLKFRNNDDRMKAA